MEQHIYNPTLQQPKGMHARLRAVLLIAASLSLSPLYAENTSTSGKKLTNASGNHQRAQEYQQVVDPKAQELSRRMTEVLTEMGQLMEKTAEENVDPGVIQRLRQLNAMYDQLSWEYEMHFGEAEFIDMENEARMEAGLEPGPQLTIQEIQELTQR